MRDFKNEWISNCSFLPSDSIKYNSRLEELRLQKAKGYYKLKDNEEWYETGHGCVAKEKRK